MSRPTLPQLFSLSWQGAIVTGGAKGIGRAVATRLAEAGAHVVVTDLDEPAGLATVHEIAERGGRAIYLHADAASADDGRRAVDACGEAFGRVDVLVNNAGIFPPSPALSTPEGLWDRVLDVNLRGPFFWTQAAARRMVEAGAGGAIVNVASIDAIHPTGGLAHYDASKAGLLMLTRSLALELGRHRIRVNTVAPGGVRTPGADEAMGTFAASLGVGAEQVTEGFVKRIPLGRMGEPDDIAAAVLFLASPAAAYVTGATLVVDGGYLTS